MDADEVWPRVNAKGRELGDVATSLGIIDQDSGGASIRTGDDVAGPMRLVILFCGSGDEQITSTASRKVYLMRISKPVKP
jgi:hypothetical protein